MAIVFNCPHCKFAYNLPDKLAGKQAKCKNPECRKVITVPAAPVTVPDDLRKGPGSAALERLALDALADEPPKVDAAPVQEKVIPMTCSFCEYKWTEPWSKAGKNTLCPNPECRQRQKVPEPKEDTPTKWRDQKTQLPTLAKQNFEKLEGVVSAGDVRNVSGSSLEDAGLMEDLYEPRSIKPYVMLGLGAVVLFAGAVFGIWSLVSSRVEKGKDALLADARTELDAKAAEMSPAGAGLSSAVLNAAACEYALNDSLVDKNPAARLKDAQEAFDKARNDVRKQPPGPERHAVAAELALATIAFAGTEAQVKEQVRYPWQPDVSPGRAMRLNERTHTIHQELTTTLSLLQPADFEFRAAVARRLTRELVKKGQPGMATDLLPVAMFSDAESTEARAVIALEVYRTDRASPLPKQVATELKAATGTGGLKGNPYPYSAQALFIALQLDKPVPVPPGAGAIPDPRPVLVNTTLFLLEGKATEALTLALRAQQPDTQLKAIALCAEWGGVEQALDAAVAAVGKFGKQLTVSPAIVLRLAQLASLAGKHDQARTLADSLADDGLKTWARGDAVRWRLTGNPKDRPDETWVEVPDDPKKVRAGHAWGRMWVARHNAKGSSATAEKKATSGWPGPVHPFALAGIALGLQDK